MRDMLNVATNISTICSFERDNYRDYYIYFLCNTLILNYYDIALG